MKNFPACLDLLEQPNRTIGIFFNTDERYVEHSFKTVVQEPPVALIINHRYLSIVNPFTSSSVHFINISTEDKLMQLRGMRFTHSFFEGLLFSNEQLRTVASRVRPFR